MNLSRALMLMLAVCWHGSAVAGELPPRPKDAPAGSVFAGAIRSLPAVEREAQIRAQFTGGNVPDFWRRFAEVKVTRSIGGREHTVIYRVSPDYLAIGSDDDYFLAPVQPVTAQTLADAVECVLPTRRMVDDIYAAAPVKLTPWPFPPGPAMTTVEVFIQHNDAVRTQRGKTLVTHPPGTLVAGHKKDIVNTPQLATAAGKVAIYGWHRPGGVPIQPLYLGHTAAWVDYSHGARFVEQGIMVDGKATTLAAVLADPELSRLLSDEGAFAVPRYLDLPSWPGEEVTEITFAHGIRAILNAPAKLREEKPLRLVLYAAPAGNSIEQTFGRTVHPGDDWHFGIQHIAAQMRWLRRQDDSADLAVACLQCAQKSWPAWRKQTAGSERDITQIVEILRQRFSSRTVELVLSGHSAGGSFVFGYLDGIDRLPAHVTRIAFLDSNYAYDPARGHRDKLAAWLGGNPGANLCVLAYHDSIALLNGKTFVSEEGGTWGRSHAMLRDFSRDFPFATRTQDGLRKSVALEGRAQLLLRENPSREILHTRLVEGNGFIHSLLTGTPLEEKGYRYLGPRAYDAMIAGRRGE